MGKEGHFAGAKQLTSRCAERQRRLRARRRSGTVMVPLEISAEGIRYLVDLGWLAAELRNEPEAVAKAVIQVTSASLIGGLHA
jgi:hypothetical protein